MRQPFIKYIFGILFAGFLVSCTKGDWLDAKPDQSLVIPTTLKDLEGLLNNDVLFNYGQPSLGEVGADNYYLHAEDFSNSSEGERNIYSWASTPNFFADGGTTTLYEWDYTYQSVFTANTVLEQIDKTAITSANQVQWSTIKGTALFYRAYAYYNLAQLYAKPYIASSAATDPGLILRLESNINNPSVRSSVQQTYDLILADLTAASSLLPATVQVKTAPSKPAAFAMLSRVYLSMQDYDHAKDYCDSTLNLINTLMDYNTLDVMSDNPFPMFTDETIYFSVSVGNALFFKQGYLGLGTVDTTLFDSYSDDDLRKQVFFKVDNDKAFFKGTYSLSFDYVFTGLATDEIYLTRAECHARKGNITEAMDDLNSLISKRWSNTVTYPIITAADAAEALQKVLAERRKELCFRGLRWTDLRRLNQDPATATTLTRVIDSETFTLAPNDDRYIYPIPNSEILYSGVQQNPR